MAAILRVKRKNTDTPLDTLVIACKRLKTEASLSDDSPVETVVQFAGTLTDPTEDVTEHVTKMLDTETHKAGGKRVYESDYPENVSGKIPKWIDVDSVTERYKITDCRSLDTLNKEEFKDKWMTLIDVEDCWSISRPQDQNAEGKEDIEDYVYDLYYAQTSDDIWFESNNIMVRGPGYSEVEVGFQEEDDSSDSNAESNWKNDYPDTDPDRSAEEDDDDDDLDESDDYLDLSFDENGYRRTRNEYGYVHRRRQELDNSSDSDLWEGSLSDKEEIVSEISDHDEVSDDEGTENT